MQIIVTWKNEEGEVERHVSSAGRGPFLGSTSLVSGPITEVKVVHPADVTCLDEEDTETFCTLDVTTTPK
jgi:hypothetical protein